MHKYAVFREEFEVRALESHLEQTTLELIDFNANLVRLCKSIIDFAQANILAHE